MAGSGYDLVINDGLVVNPWGRMRGSIGVRDEVIAAVTRQELRGDREIDAGGRAVIPGVVDVHCHYRIAQGHGPEAVVSSDDYVIGPRAAAFGGVTTFIDFAIQERGRTAREMVEARIAEAAAGSIIDFAFHASLTDPRPEVLDEIEPLMDRGIASFKFFMAYAKWGFYVDNGFLHGAMQRIGARDGVVAVHAEDDEILEFWRAHYARTAAADMLSHSLSRPELAEEVAIRSAASLARETGATLYIVHLSTARGLRAIEDGRANGATIIAETCPHYLAFTHDVYRQPTGRYFTMTPPLRADGNRQALWRGVGDGRIEVVASDHNSFTRAQKDRATGFLDVPPGLAGSEMLLPYVLSDGVAAGAITLERAVALLCANPARIYKLPAKGTVEVGKDADLVLLDLDDERVMSDEALHDPKAYSVFAGRRMRGWPVATISRGEVIVEANECRAKTGRGRFIARGTSPTARLQPSAARVRP
ncbi:MAG: dihydropyrimidinase [Chloroflexi bacterium]|nr:MAG: dihydropyrimidinase [Chloroflexota bacterium]